jgi:hypothetical protein
MAGTTDNEDNKWQGQQMIGMTNDRDEDDKWWGQQTAGTMNDEDDQGQLTTDNGGCARGTTTNGNDEQGVDCRTTSRKTSSRQWGGRMPLS